MITSTILGLLIPFIGTSLGAACVLFMKNELSVKTTKMLSGFAAGVMIAASVWSLLIPALEQSQSLGKMQFVPAVAGFMLGMFFLLILDTITPHMHLDNSVEGPKSNLSRQTMMVLAVTLHNIPEGMAVGVLYASWISGTTTITRAAALSLAIGIAIQNFPVGAISATDIISIIQSEIENFDFDTESRETGEVIYVGDGIATIYGIDHAMYGEIVVFDNGVKGMVQDIRQNEIGVILFGRDHGIHEGTKVVRTKKKAGIPVGKGFIGRIINALGEPIDGKGDIKEEDYRPIENEAPGIVDRKSVDTPLETGILSIDSMFPIGRGQRELIIGDRQTGKTSIATDTIINQKGKDVICIYVAIGQKASTVAKIVSTLTKHGAMDYSIVLSSTASDPASLQYIAPYAGTAMAEHFMHQGKDVLIVYDDLSKHAVAYRALSLLLERSPGREAYPGDVFYLHSRLLERSSRLSDELGGGSITALPIIETQAGDVSAYIPTNVISITDGQIFLESNLFNAGMRPAVNVGLSVSRVGGAAQTKAMKKASGSIRIDLAQYREMEVFTQFASDLDDATKAQLAHGKALMELLKQPLCHPLSLHEQVMTLIMANHGVFDTIETKDVKKYQGDILSYMDLSYPEIGQKIEENRAIDEELVNKIMDAVKEYKG